MKKIIDFLQKPVWQRSAGSLGAQAPKCMKEYMRRRAPEMMLRFKAKMNFERSLMSALLVLCSYGALHALPVGNPSDASLLTEGLICKGHSAHFCDPCVSWYDAMSVRVGFYGDYVYNRHMQVNDSRRDAIIDYTTLTTNAAYFALNFYDQIDFFTTLGASNIDINTNGNAILAVPNFSPYYTLTSNTSFSWSIGTRATLWEIGCATLGGEFQYFFTHPQISRITLTGEDTTYLDDAFNITYREWQLGVGLSYNIRNMLVPYLAMKWSGAQMLFDHAIFRSSVQRTMELFDLQAQKCMGWALGLSFIGCDRISCTLEGRFADEKAVHINGQIRF